MKFVLVYSEGTFPFIFAQEQFFCAEYSDFMQEYFDTFLLLYNEQVL
jgi:hypothetical protein